MKILELRFKNLNSLSGEWIIDFTHPQYTSNGIFALTGPTGAGKSTILDAICLALYGKTPRLERINKSTNEIMSRQCAECYAEVLFASQSGRYRCHWEQHRARNKADGNLQDQTHTIADADTTKILEEKKSLVVDVVIEKTGMDFDRFTRSILLAQGGFDTFLKASIEDKSRILEQITGTQLYSDISIAVHERVRTEKERLEILTAETSGIHLLTEEEEQKLVSNLETQKTEETELEAKVSDTQRAVTWLAGIKGLEDELASLSAEELQVQGDLESFQPERKKLGQALQASSLEGSYATLSANRNEQAQDSKALEAERKTLSDLEEPAKKQGQALMTAEQCTKQAKQDKEHLSPTLQDVRKLDHTLANQRQSIDGEEKRCTKEKGEIASEEANKQREEENQSKVQSNLKLVETYLVEHAVDESLIQSLGGIREQLNTLLSKQNAIQKIKNDQDKASKILGDAEKKLSRSLATVQTKQQEHDAIVKQVHDAQEVVKSLLAGRLLRELHTEKETLLREKAFREKIASLVDHRSKLEDGNPCPLCGALHHPFATGNIPALDETEEQIKALTLLIQHIEDKESEITNLQASERAIADALSVLQNNHLQIANERKTAKHCLDNFFTTLEELGSEYTAYKQTVASKVLPFGIEEVADADIQALLDNLQSRLDNYQAKTKEQTTFRDELAVIKAEIQTTEGIINTKKAAYMQRKDHITELKSELETKTEERVKLFGEKDPDVEETKLNSAIALAELNEKKTRNAFDATEKQRTTSQAHIDALNKAIGLRTPILMELERNFSLALAEEGFNDEPQFLASSLPQEERAALSEKAKKLDDRQTNLQARQSDRKRRLDDERGKHVTDKTLDELSPLKTEAEEALKNVRNAISQINHIRMEDIKNKERNREKQVAIDAQKKECLRWDKLHSLIGSADGKKYRTFAQGLTFELMVNHANHQLQKLRERYLLVRDKVQPLELNVIDTYQAGEIRSVKNLSGGESFLVSLALALGLSKMASRKVRVDSLFLDEGFGTLDEETLQTALESLANLHQDGKLIGIISHVAALKERISTQIEVLPLSGGKSTLSGPGCKQN